MVLGGTVAAPARSVRPGWVQLTARVLLIGAVVGVYFGVPFVASEFDGAALTHCMGYADEGEGFGTTFRAFPVAGVECHTTSDPDGFYLGWAG